MPSEAPPNPELALADAVADCYADPLRYVLLAFEWGKGDLKGSNGPDVWQTKLLKDIASGVLTVQSALRFAVAAGHGVGKTALVAWLILWAMSTRPHLAGVVTANTLTQLNDKTWRELAVWHKRAINARWFKWTATKFYQVDHPETWFVAAVPWSKERPEAFAGLHAEHVLVIYDEASAIDNSIYDTSEGAMTTRGAMWFAFGNPTRNSGRFRECFGVHRHRWNPFQVDARQSNVANQEQIRQWLEDYGEDSDFFRVRVRGEFPRAGSMQFIGLDVVDQAVKRDVHVSLSDPFIIGVDVARFGDDQTVIAFRKGRSANVHPWVKLRSLDTMTVASRVADEYQRYNADGLFVDEGGVGGGVVDRLRQLGIPVIGINFGSKADRVVMGQDGGLFANKRAEMWGNLRDWLKGGSIPDDPELKTDLTGVEYGYNIRNEIQLERKADMKKRGLASPDLGDALALTFAYPVESKPMAGGLFAKPKVETEFDPFRVDA